MSQITITTCGQDYVAGLRAVKHEERPLFTGRNSAQTSTRLALAEQWDDFLCEAADCFLVVGFARDGDNEVVDAGLDHGL